MERLAFTVVCIWFVLSEFFGAMENVRHVCFRERVQSKRLAVEFHNTREPEVEGFWQRFKMNEAEFFLRGRAMNSAHRESGTDAISSPKPTRQTRAKSAICGGSARDQNAMSANRSLTSQML